MRLEVSTVHAPAPALIKMEDRKRSALADPDDVAPPSKRHATAVNGASKPTYEGDMSDLELYQKDAIIRQMREYKREKGALEGQLGALEKKMAYHDDHLRIIDTWFSQMIDEIKTLANDFTTTSPSDSLTIPSTLFFAENDKFQEHLSKRTAEIKQSLQGLFNKIPAASPDVAALQQELARHLAAQKEHIVEIQRVTSEKDQLSERLENASYRYMVAEKKLDRAKSSAVAKLEAQHTQSSAPPIKTDEDGDVKMNGTSDSNHNVDEAILAKKEAVAAAEKRKEQLDALEEQNSKLTAEVTTLTAKFATLTEEDYAKTSLFKTLKSQHEDVIHRINDLEATNTQLREEAQKLQAERTAYKAQLDEESRKETMELESQIARAETDMVRLRNGRDEANAEKAILKSTSDKHSQAMTDIKDLASAREQRITALEMENERLRAQRGDAPGTPARNEEYETMSAKELRSKLISQEKLYSMLENEIPALEAALKKTQAVASKKVADITNAEEQLNRLTAEKAKADQKYFAAMKAKEARDGENRGLRAQNAKSSEIVTQLKEAESASRSLIVNLEKQITETKASLSDLTRQQAELQQKVTEGTLAAEGLRTQVTELKKQLQAKDETSLKSEKERRRAEVELEELKIRVQETKKEIGVWKKKAQDNSSTEEQALRQIAYCTVCRQNLKDTVIKSCGHVFCKDCIDRRTKERSRKCPTCMKAFGIGDIQEIYLAG